MLVVRGQERLDHGLRRLSDLATRRESERTAKLRSLDQLLQTLGYEATLNRGYAVVRGDGRVVTTRDEAAATKALEIQFADGRIGAKSTG